MTIMNNILDIIPQRPPFVFVDEVVAINGISAVLSYRVATDCPLLSDGYLSIAGVLEHVAQSCAARIGYLQSQTNQPIRIGYIGGVKSIEVLRNPLVGELLTTEVELIEEVFDISLLSCTTRVEDDVIAQTTIKLALV